MLVKKLMTRNVITVTEDSSLKEVGKILKEKRISGIPVVNDEGTIVGIVTLTDMLRVLNQVYNWKEIEKRDLELKIGEMFEKEKSKAKVKDIMTKNVHTLDDNTTLDDVMRLMFTNKIHTIPIVKDGKLVGIVGKRDLLYACF